MDLSVVWFLAVNIITLRFIHVVVSINNSIRKIWPPDIQFDIIIFMSKISIVNQKFSLTFDPWPNLCNGNKTKIHVLIHDQTYVMEIKPKSMCWSMKFLNVTCLNILWYLIWPVFSQMLIKIVFYRQTTPAVLLRYHLHFLLKNKAWVISGTQPCSK